MDAIPEIVSIVQELGLNLQVLPRPPVLAYPVRRWADIAWSGSTGPRHRAMFETSALVKTPLYGVIGQLRGVALAPPSPSPVLFVWRREPDASAGSSWKFVTMFPIMRR